MTDRIATEDLRRMHAARLGPHVTCPTSRHAAMIAEAMAAGDHDQQHQGGSIASTVASLWEARAREAELRAALTQINVGDGWAAQIARAALSQPDSREGGGMTDTLTISRRPTRAQIVAWAEAALRNVPGAVLTDDLIRDLADGLPALAVPAPAVPDDVAALVADLRQDHDDAAIFPPDTPTIFSAAADALEAQAAELARYREALRINAAILAQATFVSRDFGHWTVAECGWRGTLDDALDLANAALSAAALLDERDLSAAREAAAWIAGRDAAAEEAFYACGCKDSIEAITPPTDGQAALDRLIAERVREAVEAARDVAADEMRAIVEMMRQAAEQSCQIVMDQAKECGIPQMALGAKACRDGIRELKLDAARGSKEGRDNE